MKDRNIAVQFGAGNIGRGLMGHLFWQAGLETVFVNRNASRADRLNRRGSYPLRVLDAYSRSVRELTIGRFRVLSTHQSSEIAEAIAQARVAATAAGVASLGSIAPMLAQGLHRRFERQAGPLDVYLCENTLNAAEQLSRAVMGLLDGPVRSWTETNIGFVGTCLAGIVGGDGARSADDDPLLVIADAHRDVPYDGRATRAGDPAIQGFHPVGNFLAEVERKIFTNNVGHAALAYLGYLRGHTYIYETFDDDFVRSTFDGALDETTEALLRRYPADLDRREHIEFRKDVRIRFGNPLLRDTVARVARDPIRKLGREDRIVGAAELCRSEGICPNHIATICAAALRYDHREDPHAIRLQAMSRETGVGETLRQICGVDPSDDFGRKVLARYRDLPARSLTA
jgi:mannitol-1-phosphate 5-dehydrogenase